MDKLPPRIQLYLFWIASLSTFFLFTFWTCFSFLEFWKVAVQKKIYNYVFDGRPWYYGSPQLYTKVMLIEGLIMLALLALVTYYIIKKRNAIYLMLIAGLVYSFVTFIYNQSV